MEFECSGCGACCRKAAEFGLVPTKDGHCIYLTEDNQCEIYKTRPTICNISAMYALRKANGFSMSKEEYFALNAQFCNEFMDSYQIDKKLRVDPSIYKGTS
tara:strand:- start:206 stop:508 length:303 start_codon:yes stop_codon:yes gene_type:complete